LGKVKPRMTIALYLKSWVLFVVQELIRACIPFIVGGIVFCQLDDERYSRLGAKMFYISLSIAIVCCFFLLGRGSRWKDQVDAAKKAVSS